MANLFEHFIGNKCEYCHNEGLPQKDLWKSEWGSDTGHHYNTATCNDCGKRNWKLCNTDGSGHNKETCSLESCVKKVRTL
jgi:hypothetical protein